MAIRCKVHGLRAVTRNLLAVANRAGDAFGDGIEAEGEAVHRVADLIVPRDTGRLAETGKVTVRRSRRATVAAISYGGEGVEYAVRQHEDLTLNHRPGQQAKYLEVPALAAVPGLPKRQAGRLKGALHG